VPLRPARCYTHQENPPYTRKEYIHGIPMPKIAKFVTGNNKLNAEVKLELMAIERGIIRHNALEAARVIAQKYLSNNVGDLNYLLVIKSYPHHVIREHKMLAFAGADRLQEGMRHAFGKPAGVAVRAEPGTVIIEIYGLKQHLEHLKEAMRRSMSKLPIRCRIVVKELNKQ